MSTRVERIAAVDAFMAATKMVMRPDVQHFWSPGHDQDELIHTWPLQVEGELPPGASFAVIGNPRRGPMFFRLMILFPGAICRLDHTDETHVNAPAICPPDTARWIRGPHYHSWNLNRLRFKDFVRAPELPLAVPYPGGGQTFDAILRWFCNDTRIAALPPNHRIELPVLGRLL